MDWGLLFVAAAAIVGVLEWVKYLVLKVWPKAPTWLWHLALLPATVGAALALPGSAGIRVLSAGVLLLVTQVGYQLIVQGVLGAIKAAVERAASPKS